MPDGPGPSASGVRPGRSGAVGRGGQRATSSSMGSTGASWEREVRRSHRMSRPNDQTSRARATATTRRSPGTAAGPRRPAGADALERGDRLAGHARREGALSHGSDAGRGDEGVPHGADQQHPRAQRHRDVHAEHQDQERVDLHVEAGAQRGRGAGAAGDLAVDAVEDQGHRGQTDEQRDRRRALEGVGDQRGDTADQCRPAEGHPVGRAEGARPGAVQGPGEHRPGGEGEGEPGQPARRPHADRRAEQGQQQDLQRPLPPRSPAGPASRRKCCSGPPHILRPGDRVDQGRVLCATCAHLGTWNRFPIVQEDADEAHRACFLAQLARSRARSVTSPCRTPPQDEVLVRALYSGVSRGTETLVFRGGVPESQYAAMRAPFQEGDFPAPVKYGYLSVGVVEEGPDALVGRTVFCLYPHQTPLRRPGERRDRRAGRPCPPDGPSSPGPWRPPSTPCGTRRRWSATGSRSSAAAWSAARWPPCWPASPGVRVQLVDADPARATIAEALGVDFAAPEDALGRLRPRRPRQRHRAGPDPLPRTARPPKARSSN